MPPSAPYPHLGDPVIERKHRLDGSQVDFACQVCALVPGQQAVIYYLTDRSWEIIPSRVTVPSGTHSFGYFWADRPYNLYHWVGPKGPTFGYYFNVARQTRIRPGLVEWSDMVLDYCLDSQGIGVFLDEAELDGDISPADRLYIARAKSLLLRQALALSEEITPTSQSYLAQFLSSRPN